MNRAVKPLFVAAGVLVGWPLLAYLALLGWGGYLMAIDELETTPAPSWMNEVYGVAMCSAAVGTLLFGVGAVLFVMSARRSS